MNNLCFPLMYIVGLDMSQGSYCDGKEFEIYTAGLEFESGRASLVRA